MTEDEILVFETAQIMRGDGDREIGALSMKCHTGHYSIDGGYSIMGASAERIKRGN